MLIQLAMCAGTSLGDPIEVGAAGAVLVDSRQAGMAPLVLMAAKSWTGHAEPGAGIVGLAHAQASLTQAAALPILHGESFMQVPWRWVERCSTGQRPGSLGCFQAITQTIQRCLV